MILKILIAVNFFAQCNFQTISSVPPLSATTPSVSIVTLPWPYPPYTISVGTLPTVPPLSTTTVLPSPSLSPNSTTVAPPPSTTASRQMTVSTTPQLPLSQDPCAPEAIIEEPPLPKNSSRFSNTSVYCESRSDPKRKTELYNIRLNGTLKNIICSNRVVTTFLVLTTDYCKLNDACKKAGFDFVQFGYGWAPFQYQNTIAEHRVNDNSAEYPRYVSATTVDKC